MSFLIAYQSNPNANKINQMAIVTCLYLFWSWGNKDNNIKKRYRGWLNYSNICFSSLYRAQSDNNWSFVTAKSEDLIIFAKNNKGNKQNVQIRSRWVHLWPIYADLFAKVVSLKSFLSPPMYSDVLRESSLSRVWHTSFFLSEMMDDKRIWNSEGVWYVK